uniref:ARAD1C04906p n=1 Tax=Blastobotrys adeninivorans TaxID=409370 RepID=A0A060SZH2_BLAAD
MLKFRAHRGIVSPYTANAKLNEGYQLEERMRVAIISKNTEHIDSIVEEAQKVLETKARNEQRALASNANKKIMPKTRMEIHHGKIAAAREAKLKAYNAPPTGYELDSVRSKNRILTYHRRIVNRGPLSAKAAADPFYIDTIMVPELRQKILLRNQDTKYNILLSRPRQVKLGELTTPIVIMPYLRIEGKPQSRRQSAAIRKAYMVQFHEEERKLQSQLDIAQQYAQETGDKEWTNEVNNQLEQLREHRSAAIYKAEYYRRVLIARQRLLQRTFAAEHERKKPRRLAKWKRLHQFSIHRLRLRHASSTID